MHMHAASRGTSHVRQQQQQQQLLFGSMPAHNQQGRARPVCTRHPTPPQATIKSLAGQVTLFPTYTSLVLLYAALLEGQGLSAGVERIQAKLPTLFVAGGVYWPVVNLLNFMYVPTAQRVLAINISALAWNSYLRCGWR